MLKYLFLFLFLASPVYADQAVETITTDDLASEWPTVWNNFLDSIMTSHSGTSRPSYAQAGTFWYNTSSKTLNLYDGASDIVVTTFDTTNHYLNPAVGGGTATLASASTTNLGSVVPAFVSITGTTTITSFGSSMLPGQVKILTFASSLLLTHNGTSLILPGAADITVDAGSSVVVVCLSTGNYRVVSYQPASTSALPTIASNTGLVNITGGAATPSATTLTAWIDSAIGNTQGSILYRGASTWSALAPGTSGQALLAQGAGANPIWSTLVASQTGNSGKYLTTNGTTTSWATISTGITSCTTVTGTAGRPSTATCPSGYIRTGGGACGETSENGKWVKNSYPYSTNAWRCDSECRLQSTTVNCDLNCIAYAICCN